MPLPLKIQAARLTVVYQAPYFSTPAMALTPIESEKCVDPGGEPTMAVDKWWRWYYHPAIVDKWTKDEMAGVICHEINHLIRAHHPRQANLSAEHLPWNMAGDCEINDDMAESGFKLPKGALMPAVFGCKDHEMAETYYEQIMKKAKKVKVSVGSGQCGSGAGGERNPAEGDSNGNGVKDENGDPAPKVSKTEGELIAREVAQKVKQYGNAPAGLKQWAEALLKPPEIPWQKELQGAARRAVTWVLGRKDFTYRKVNKKYLPHLILPTMQTPEVNIAVYIDVSGSMLGPPLEKAMVEIRGILKTVSTRGAKVAAVDTVVGPCRKAFQTKDVELVGGGGTDMGAAIRHAEESRPHPDIVVVLTDGYTPWPDRAPNKPFKTIVCLFGDCDEATVPDWARKIRVKC